MLQHRNSGWLHNLRLFMDSMAIVMAMSYFQPLSLPEYTFYHISLPTYAYLIIRLSISDTLELKLVERLRKLPLGCWQTWKRTRKKNMDERRHVRSIAFLAGAIWRSLLAPSKCDNTRARWQIEALMMRLHGRKFPKNPESHQPGQPLHHFPITQELPRAPGRHVHAASLASSFDFNARKESPSKHQHPIQMGWKRSPVQPSGLHVSWIP